MFSGLAIDKLEKEWKEHPVFHFSFAASNYTSHGAMERIIDAKLSEYESIYGNESKDSSDFAIRFLYLIKSAYEKTGSRVVVLIDEYDKPLLDVMELDRYITDSDGNKVTLE